VSEEVLEALYACFRKRRSVERGDVGGHMFGIAGA
jgi:hypothetical protein